eukprot:8725186-Alexandrium_andersonii.AAC.1
MFAGRAVLATVHARRCAVQPITRDLSPLRCNTASLAIRAAEQRSLCHSACCRAARNDNAHIGGGWNRTWH